MGLMSWLLQKFIRVTIDIAVLLLVFILLPGIPPDVSFTTFEVDPPLPLEGPLARNNKLDAAERIMDGRIVGPESIASRDPEEIFVSLHGGKILRIWGHRFDHFKIVTSIGPGCAGPWQETKCGRPLGLRFAPDGRLIVADAYLGLFSVDVDNGEKEQLFDISQEIDGVVPKLPDDIDIDSEGNIYWSDASTVSNLANGMIELLSAPSGRIIKFDPKTKTNTVLVKNIHFANGVQLSPDNDFVLFCETFRNRVHRHWLKGPKSGQTEVFVERLPGMPDNIRSKDGGYYVSLVSINSKSVGDVGAVLVKFPILRKLILRLLAVTKFIVESASKIYPNENTEKLASKIFHLDSVGKANLQASNLTIVVELDADGNIVNSLQGNSGKIVSISETARVGDNLFFGSPYNKYLGRLFVGSPVMEVDGKGVSMKREKDTDENEAEIKNIEPGLQKDEEDGFQMEEKKVLVEESLQEENVKDTAQKSKVQELSNEEEVEQPEKVDFDSVVEEKSEKPIQEEAFVVENKEDTDQKQVDIEKEELGQKVENLLEEEWKDVQKEEGAKEVPDMEKQDEISEKDIMKEEL